MTGLEIAMLVLLCLSVGMGLAFGLMLWGQRPPRKLIVAPDANVEATAEDVIDNGARVFDANNPPHYARYNPKNYDPERAPRCTCHDQRIEQGDKVLIWPIPDHPEGGMDLFCHRTFRDTGVPK